MSPVVDELAHDLDGQANVVKVNVDESPDLASEYAVQSIPTFIVVRDGGATQRLVGMQTKQALVKAVAG
jgi:thioredoxin 1